MIFKNSESDDLLKCSPINICEESTPGIVKYTGKQEDSNFHVEVLHQKVTIILVLHILPLTTPGGPLTQPIQPSENVNDNIEVPVNLNRLIFKLDEKRNAICVTMKINFRTE